jgi:hypothetical protein
MVSEPGLCTTIPRIDPSIRTTALAAHPANLKQGPALKFDTGLICTVYLSLTVPWNPSEGQQKDFARAGNKALIYNI